MIIIKFVFYIIGFCIISILISAFLLLLILIITYINIVVDKINNYIEIQNNDQTPLWKRIKLSASKFLFILYSTPYKLFSKIINIKL